MTEQMECLENIITEVGSTLKSWFCPILTLDFEQAAYCLCTLFCLKNRDTIPYLMLL